MATSVKTLPAPIGGLNAYDSIVGMPDTDAITLVNLFPQAYGCALRRGYQEVASGAGAEIQTLFPLYNKDGSSALYAFAGGNMWNATAGGTLSSPLLTTLLSAIWQFTSFGNSAGVHGVGFNGFDDGIWINQTLGLQRLVLGDGIVNATWKNVDPKNLVDCTVHQRRLWAVEKNTSYGWYLPPDQIYGVASKFDFGPLFKKGGYLASLATWTVDAGSGSDDQLVAISSQGEVAVYAGVDPSTLGSWILKGVYSTGGAVSGRRFHSKVGGDLMIVTDQGVLSVAEMLASNKTQQSQVAVDAKKVQQPISNAASLIGSIFGWQAYFCPQFNMFIVNIPSVTTEGNMQFAQNTINGGWCTFSGYDASHFVTFNKLPYFGAKDGKIYKAWYGNVDKTTQAGTGGTEILGKVQQSYSYLAAPAVQKQIGMYRPTFLVATDATYGSQVAYDFAFSTAPIVNAAPIQNTAVWDTGIWDTSYWAGELKAQRQWSQAEGMGTAISFVFTIRSRYETLWVGTDYTFKTGGVF